MTNDIKLEIEDTETGTVLTVTPSDEGVYVVIEDDESDVTINLDGSHAYTLANLILQILEDQAGEAEDPVTQPESYGIRHALGWGRERGEAL